MKKQQKQTQNGNKKRKILLATLIPTATVAVAAGVTLPLVLVKNAEPEIEGIRMTYESTLTPGTYTEEIDAYISASNTYQPGDYTFYYVYDSSTGAADRFAFVKDTNRRTALAPWTINKVTRNGREISFTQSSDNIVRFNEEWEYEGTFKIEVTANSVEEDICLVAWHDE